MDIRSILADHGLENARNASVDLDMSDINQKITDLDQFVNGSFLDGIVTQIEAKKIQAYINSLQDSNKKVQERYNAIFNNEGLTDEPTKDELFAAKAGYDLEFNKLIGDIETSIADGVATKDESDLVDNDYLSLMDSSARLEKALEAARDSILGKRTSDVQQAANAYTDQAKADIEAITDSIQTRLNATEGYIDGAFRDGIVTEYEAKNIQSYLDSLSMQKTQLDNKYNEIYNNYFLSDDVPKANLLDAKTKYDTQYQTLVDTINNAIADNTATPAESDSVRQGFVDLDSALALLTSCMEKAIEALSQSRADNAEAMAKQGANDYTDRQVGTIDTILKDIASDDLVTQSERGSIKDDITRIIGYILGDVDNMPELDALDASQKGEVYLARQDALNAGIPGTDQEYLDIGDTYNALKEYLNAMTPKPWDVTSADNITVDKDVWRNTWLNYYLSISVVKAKISEALKQNADSKVTISDYTNDMATVNGRIDDTNKKVTISCYIQSSNGFIFKNGNLQTTLTAVVRQGPDDITDTIDNTRFVWRRTSSDTVGDQTWNQNHINVGPVVDVSYEDVSMRATFSCDILDVT